MRIPTPSVVAVAFITVLPVKASAQGPPGRPAGAAPLAELDIEFDEGSRIGTVELGAADASRLSLLGRVWGFAKYHHPKIRRGEVNWDYELFRVLPSVLAATEHEDVLAALAAWLNRLGDPPPCEPCVGEALDAHLTPDLDWIRDRRVLGVELSARLQLLRARRPANPGDYLVRGAPGVGNPNFSDEDSYSDQPLPDPGYRLLGLYRFWNIIEYWFPYRNLIERPWEEVLGDFLPRVINAQTIDEYRLVMQELSVSIDDSHSNVRAALDLRPPQGPGELPVVVRFVQGRAVVTGYKDPVRGPATGLDIGDVIEEIDGLPVDSLVLAWRPFYSASNEPRRLLDIGRRLTKGQLGSVQISGVRPDGRFTLQADRVPTGALDPWAGRTDDLPGATFQMLTEDVAYLKLSSVVAGDAPDYIAQAAGADVLVIDIRNYPSSFVVFALGGHLVSEPVEFARFTVGDFTSPGAFRWTDPLSLQPREPSFAGHVVILVNEFSISQSEYTAMAFRASPRAVVVGSMTAGADGNVSQIPLPGGITGLISGIGVFYPDKSPTQQVGIIPDLEVRPTIAGIREGRDEVLEAGVSFVIGREFRLQGR